MNFRKLAGKNWKGIEAIDYYDEDETYIVYLKPGWEQEGYGVDSFVIGEDDDMDVIKYQFSLIQRAA